MLRNAQTRLFEAVKPVARRTIWPPKRENLAATVEQFVVQFAVAQARVLPGRSSIA